MLDFMPWSEIVDNLLQESKLKMAVIFDLSGVKLAASQGVTISEHEAKGVLQSLQIPANTGAASSMFGLYLGGSQVNCLRLDDRSLIGKTSSEVFVAYRADNVLVCGYSSLEGKISCLGSVRDFALKLNTQTVTASGHPAAVGAASAAAAVVAPPSLI
ncbi:hypothetical protein ACOMHN_064852 [Nucella lapillus]